MLLFTLNIPYEGLIAGGKRQRIALPVPFPVFTGSVRRGNQQSNIPVPAIRDNFQYETLPRRIRKSRKDFRRDAVITLPVDLPQEFINHSRFHIQPIPFPVFAGSVKYRFHRSLGTPHVPPNPVKHKIRVIRTSPRPFPINPPLQHGWDHLNRGSTGPAFNLRMSIEPEYKIRLSLIDKVKGRVVIYP